MSSSQFQTSNSCAKPVSAPVAFSFHIYVSSKQYNLPILEEALLQAREGRKHILGEMMKCSPKKSFQVCSSGSHYEG
ncbi:polyribonucleotide nucleotidyltransferase [Trifolium repens]|nr:polyribonucleotide nucleotidyltransferase [Trifolium repens]